MSTIQKYFHVTKRGGEKHDAHRQSLPRTPSPTGCQQDMTIPFLDFPAEVRNLIYAFHCGDICIVVRNQGHIKLFRPQYNPVGDPGRRPGWRFYNPERRGHWPLSLLITCRLVGTELLYELYRRATFFFEGRYDLITAYNRNGLNFATGFPQIPGMINLASPFYRITALNIDLSSTDDFGGRIGAGESMRVTEAVMDIVTYNMPQLEHLQLEVNTRAKIFITDRLLQPWFIRSLGRLRILGLKYFGINFTGVTARTRSKKVLDAASCIFAVQGVISWYCCGSTGKAATRLAPPLDSPRYDDKALQRLMCREIIVFLKNSPVIDHTRLIGLLEADIKALG